MIDAEVAAEREERTKRTKELRDMMLQVQATPEDLIRLADVLATRQSLFQKARRKLATAAIELILPTFAASRGLKGMIARHFVFPDAPFQPGVHLRSSLFEGDEALAGNLPPTESYPERTFTTDALGFHGVQQPFVGAKILVEPQRMVETRNLEILAGEMTAVGDQADVDQEGIGHIREQRLL